MEEVKSVSELVRSQNWKERQTGCLILQETWRKDAFQYRDLLGTILEENIVAVLEQALAAALVLVETAQLIEYREFDTLHRYFNLKKKKVTDTIVQIYLTLFEKGHSDSVFESLIVATESQKHRTVEEAIAAMTEIVKHNGITNHLNRIYTPASEWVVHKEPAIRQNSMTLLSIISHFKGESVVPLLGGELRSTTISEILKYEANIDRSLRPTRGAKAEAPERVDNEEEEVVEVDDSVPFDLLTSINDSFFVSVSSEQWIERKNALETLKSLLVYKKYLEENRQYNRIYSVLTSKLEDKNNAVTQCSIECIGLLSKGLTNVPNVSVLLKALLSKFKEKRTQIIQALHAAITPLIRFFSHEELFEACSSSLANTAFPQLKCEAIVVMTNGLKMKAPLEFCERPFMSVLQATGDSMPSIRDSAFEYLGLCYLLYNRSTAETLEKSLTSAKMERVKSSAERHKELPLRWETNKRVSIGKRSDLKTESAKPKQETSQTESQQSQSTESCCDFLTGKTKWRPPHKQKQHVKSVWSDEVSNESAQNPFSGKTKEVEHDRPEKFNDSPVVKSCVYDKEKAPEVGEKIENEIDMRRLSLEINRSDQREVLHSNMEKDSSCCDDSHGWTLLLSSRKHTLDESRELLAKIKNTSHLLNHAEKLSCIDFVALCSKDQRLETACIDAVLSLGKVLDSNYFYEALLNHETTNLTPRILFELSANVYGELDRKIIEHVDRLISSNTNELVRFKRFIQYTKNPRNFDWDSTTEEEAKEQIQRTALELLMSSNSMDNMRALDLLTIDNNSMMILSNCSDREYDFKQKAFMLVSALPTSALKLRTLFSLGSVQNVLSLYNKREELEQLVTILPEVPLTSAEKIEIIQTLDPCEGRALFEPLFSFEHVRNTYYSLFCCTYSRRFFDVSYASRTVTPQKKTQALENYLTNVFNPEYISVYIDYHNRSDKIGIDYLISKLFEQRCSLYDSEGLAIVENIARTCKVSQIPSLIHVCGSKRLVDLLFCYLYEYPMNVISLLNVIASEYTITLTNDQIELLNNLTEEPLAAAKEFLIRVPEALISDAQEPFYDAVEEKLLTPNEVITLLRRRNATDTKTALFNLHKIMNQDPKRINQSSNELIDILLDCVRDGSYAEVVDSIISIIEKMASYALISDNNLHSLAEVSIRINNNVQEELRPRMQNLFVSALGRERPGLGLRILLGLLAELLVVDTPSKEYVTTLLWKVVKGISNKSIERDSMVIIELLHSFYKFVSPQVKENTSNQYCLKTVKMLIVRLVEALGDDVLEYDLKGILKYYVEGIIKLKRERALSKKVA